jgi:hypothetical protein
MASIWGAADGGNLDEVERLVGQDAGLLNARSSGSMTPLCDATTPGLAVA